MIRKIVIVDHREEGFESEKKSFAREDAELVICQCSGEHELIEAVRDAFIVIFTSSKFTSKVISSLTNCRMLIRYGIGLDNVDIGAATEKGIYVCNTPDYGTFAVAEHAFALLISLVRKIMLLDKNVRNNIWSLDAIDPIHTLRYKTLGIAGFGNIGRHLSRMAQAFDMDVIISDPYVDDEVAKEFRVTKTTLEDLVIKSDHISLHAPLTPETMHLFNMTLFKKMKPSATIINTGRGGLISQNDLISALRSGDIAGAGLDVFESEPLAQDNELLKMSNVLLSPHVAWYTEESVVNLHLEVIEEVLRVLQGNKPLNCVNIKV
jgi:D-3-phosphoglycerate dehydrogenase